MDRPAATEQLTVRAAVFALLCAVAAGCAPAGGGAAGLGPETGYVAYVASESADEVARIRFADGRVTVEERTAVGIRPADLEGPHGIAISPDRQFLYVTLAHGTPFGTLWKISAETGDVVARTPLGLFPATVAVTPDGQFAFVSNFNLHGDHVPSSVSKVFLPTMTEVARTETCTMPHGSRINPAGTEQYSVCMMDDMLVQVDVASGEVSARFSVRPGEEGPLPPAAAAGPIQHAAARVCSPTWAEPAATGNSVYVACNKSNEILEIDTGEWRVTRRFATGANPYNLAASPDGRLLLATLKNRDEPATEIIDLGTSRTIGRVPASAILPHGVAVTGDSRYAFVSVEGIGPDPGKVDVIELATARRVASAEVGPQAGGIAVAPSR